MNSFTWLPPALSRSDLDLLSRTAAGVGILRPEDLGKELHTLRHLQVTLWAHLGACFRDLLTFLQVPTLNGGMTTLTAGKAEMLSSLCFFVFCVYTCESSCVCVCVCVCTCAACVLSGLPRPPPQDLPDPRIKPTSLMSPALAVRFFTVWASRETC